MVCYVLVRNSVIGKGKLPLERHLGSSCSHKHRHLDAYAKKLGVSYRHRSSTSADSCNPACTKSLQPFSRGHGCIGDLTAFTRRSSKTCVPMNMDLERGQNLQIVHPQSRRIEKFAHVSSSCIGALFDIRAECQNRKPRGDVKFELISLRHSRVSATVCSIESNHVLG